MDSCFFVTVLNSELIELRLHCSGEFPMAGLVNSQLKVNFRVCLMCFLEQVSGLYGSHLAQQ